MNERETTLATLRQEKRKIEERLSRLKGERDAIDTTIFYFMGGTQLSIEDVHEEKSHRAAGPTEAIRNLFNNNPNRKWLPGQFRNELQHMKKSGDLISDSKHILSTVHWILRALVERGEIEKGGNSKIKWYRKLENSQM